MNAEEKKTSNEKEKKFVQKKEKKTKSNSPVLLSLSFSLLSIDKSKIPIVLLIVNSQGPSLNPFPLTQHGHMTPIMTPARTTKWEP
jgi:hypothetical protein